MHRALLVSEVLQEIFSHLTEKKFLAALARTSKSFYDTAMDLLWAEIYNIDPLLGCVERLHPMIYSGLPKQYSSKSWSDGVEPLSKYEARQFLRHAARVRTLLIHGYDIIVLPPTPHYHLHLLSFLPIETCMFPRLLSLKWIVRHPDDKYLHLFLSPTLRHCHLLTIHCDLKSIARRCAALESLSIADSVDPVAAYDISVLSDTVRSCNRLVKLCCPLLDSAALEYLSKLPTLVTMTINGFSTDDLLERDGLDFVHFPNLTALSLSLSTLHFVAATNFTTFMQRSGFPSLKEFRLRVLHDFHWAQVERIIGALSQHKACQILEDVEIPCDPEPLEYLDNPLPVIRQLLPFTQLRFLELDVGPLYLDNDLLLEAMSSWPHIEYLHLERSDECEPAVTFRVLFAALRLCPRLHTLQVLMDASFIDIDPEVESFKHPSLQKLHLSDSWIRDAEAVALIIFSMLPLVDEVTYDGYRDSSLLLWGEVNTHLSSFSQAV